MTISQHQSGGDPRRERTQPHPTTPNPTSRLNACPPLDSPLCVRVLTPDFVGAV